MSYDQLIGSGGFWNPSINGDISSAQNAGDGNYNMPSGTTMGTLGTAGSQLLPLTTLISAGSISGWPSTPSGSDTTTVPSIAQISASSGINQILGLLNRRIVYCNSLNNGLAGYSPGTPIPYITSTGLGSGTGMATKFQAIYAAIATLLAAEGFTSNPYAILPNNTGTAWPPTTNVAGGVYTDPSRLVYAYHVANMRKALCLTGLQKISIRYLREWGWEERDGTTWGTPTYGPAVNQWSFTFVGRQDTDRCRMVYYYGIPEYAALAGSPTFQSAYFEAQLCTFASQTRAWQFDVFSLKSNTMPPIASSFDISGATDNYEGGVPSSSMSSYNATSPPNYGFTTTDIPVTPANIANVAYIPGTNNGQIPYLTVLNVEAPNAGSLDGTSTSVPSNITDSDICYVTNNVEPILFLQWD